VAGENIEKNKMADLSDYKIYKNNDFEILTDEGFKDFKGLIVGKNNKKLKLYFSNGEILNCTPKHKIMISSKKWKYAKNSKIGDVFWNNISLIKKEEYENNDPVYEFLEVVDNHKYISNNILSHQCLIIDEMAHIQNDLMEELWKSVIPTITSSKKSQIVGISTPNGADKENKFYQLYLEAQKPDSGWKLEKVHWSENDDRNEEWKKSEIASLGSLHTFQQEHENMFHALGKSVISAEHLEELKKLCKEPILATDEGSYKIYRQPKPTSHYIIGVDVGEGIGRTNTVAQILDVSDLTNIEQVAIFASNTITPYHFGTRLIGIANDWGRPPILIENNNYGQQVLDVVARTHNYESVVTYKFEGMSQHYNNENRLGIYNHTNTRYRSMTNFRYWVDSLKAVKIFDLDTLIEIAEFVQLPNYTFSKKNESDRDDRVWSLVWALFILEPTLAQKYFNVKQTDDQGRPLFMTPFIDNSDLIKKSPIIFGTVNTTKKEISYNAPLAYLPEGKIKEDPAVISEGLGFQSELLKWEPNITKNRYEYEYKSHSPEIIWRSNDKKEQELKNEDGYNPLVFF